MQLTGGGNWITLQKGDVGSTTRGAFVSFEEKVPSSNPAFPPQDVLSLEVDGEIKKIGCPTALGRVFRMNKVAPGTLLDITYEGKKKGKGPLPFHSFDVRTVDGEADASFGFGANVKAANEPMAGNDEAALEAKLAAARARRAA